MWYRIEGPGIVAIQAESVAEAEWLKANTDTKLEYYGVVCDSYRMADDILTAARDSGFTITWEHD